jgi:uncharacterized protein (TIGR02996 family)
MHSLSPSPATPAAAFEEDMREYPEDAVPRLVFADWLDECGDASRAEVVRGVEEVRRRCPGLQLARPDHLALLRGKGLLAGECRGTAEVLRRLLACDPSALSQQQLTAVEARLSTALEAPARAKERLSPLDEGNLRFQYDFQRTLLASLDLPIGQDCFGEIRQQLQRPALREQVERGRTLLLLSPRVPFPRAIAALERGLRRNAHLLAEGGRLHDPPVYVSMSYEEEGLLYHPARLEAGAPAQTEGEWLAGGKTDVLLVAPAAQFPREECYRSSAQAVEQRLPGEVFLTPQDYVLLFLTLLELRGVPLDRDTFSYLPGSRFASSRYVPRAGWSLEKRQLCMGWENQDYRFVGAGVRAAARVM